MNAIQLGIGVGLDHKIFQFDNNQTGRAEAPRTERIQVPRIRKDRKELVLKGNTAIHKIKSVTEEPIAVTKINQLIFAIASVITEELGAMIQVKHQRLQKNLEQ